MGLLLILVLSAIFNSHSFHLNRSFLTNNIKLASSSDSPDPNELTRIGSKEYYEGFFGRPIENDINRGNGLKQALSLAGYSTILLAILVLGFLKSNGLF